MYVCGLMPTRKAERKRRSKRKKKERKTGYEEIFGRIVYKKE